ncbi:conserved Plasmodium protein, unknown function [Plasmodium berghei]|uniref:Uncharacterized protein n=1 Tax=Plasmodium berghei TaxID=5821 RepID=A0A1C6Y8F5_PLABE|nr:conserved Plasmodium protein, unknown function [Plasmodium berghei]SCN23349.1 conserved Plasmodium protein, unknown function [Plasmodium berghei]SCO59608.1 conserved Plasmodium protein, unknown function [Plasmodium berghei]
MPEKKKDIFIFKKWCYISKQKDKKNEQWRNRLRKWKYICRHIYLGKLCSLKLRLKKNVDLKRSIKIIRDNIYNLRIKKISVSDSDNNILYVDKKITSEDENMNSLKNSVENRNVMLLFSKKLNDNYIKNKYYDDRISSTNSTCASSICYDEYAYKSSNVKNSDNDNNNRNVMRKPKKSFPNTNKINIDFLNQIHCSRIVEAHSLFTFFYTKLKRKDKDYYKNKMMMHKKNALYVNKLNKENNPELNNQYIPKNQEQIYNDIKCKSTKATPPYKCYSNDNQNNENNYNNINNIYGSHNEKCSLEKEGQKHNLNHFNNNAAMENSNKQEHENKNDEENAEMNEERFLDEFDDFDINEEFKEKTYYTDRCMLDRNGKRVSILDKLNINFYDKKNVANNEELNPINLSSNRKEKIGKKLSLNSKMLINDPPTVNINEEEADININEDNEYINNLKEDNHKIDINIVKNSVIITNNTSINSKMAHLKKNNKMHPPKKCINNNIVKEGIKMNCDRGKIDDRIVDNKINKKKICKINYDMNKQMSHDTSSKIKYNMNRQPGHNVNNPMEYNMNNPMGYSMNNLMGYNMNNPMGYSMNNIMGYNMNNPMEYNTNNLMEYNMNNPMEYNMNNQMEYNMNNPMEHNMSNKIDLINNYTGNMNSGSFNVPMVNPLWSENEHIMHSTIQGSLYNMNNNMDNVNRIRQGNNQIVPYNRNEEKSVKMNNKNLLLYNNDNIKYDKDFTLNYILQKYEDDDHFFSNNNSNYEENIDDKKTELEKYTEGMNKLVEQMYFYDNYHEELKICEKDEITSSNTYNIIDTSLNLNVVDENDEEGKENKEIISQMKLKIINLEEKLEELKNKKNEPESNLKELNDKKRCVESQNNKIINELKKEIENIKKKRRKKKQKKKKGREKKKQAEENKEQKGVNEGKNNEEIQEPEKNENEEIKNFNIDNIIDTDNLNNLKNEIMNNVYYYIYESYDQKDYDILENLAKKHEIKGRKICYNVNLPKYDFKNKRTSSLWFLNPAYENYVLEKKKTQKIGNLSSASYEKLEFLFNSNDMIKFSENDGENKSVMNSDIRDSEFSYETFISEKKKKLKKNKINLIKMKNSLTLQGKSENNILNKNSMNNINKYALEDANKQVIKKEEDPPQVEEVNQEGTYMVNDLLDTINNYVPDKSIFDIFSAPLNDVKGKEEIEPGEMNENEKGNDEKKVVNNEKDVDDIFKEVEAKMNNKIMKEIEEKKRERELLDLEIENKKKKKELEELELQLMENKRKSLLASKNINEIETEMKLNKKKKGEENKEDDIKIDKEPYEKENEIVVLNKKENKVDEEEPNEQIVEENKNEKNEQVEIENNRKPSDVSIANDLLNDYVKNQKKKERKKNNWALYGRPKVNKERNRILKRLSSSKSDGGFNDYTYMAERFFEIVTGYTSDQDIAYDDNKEKDDANNENERNEERKKKIFNIRIRMKENVYKNDAFYKLGRPKYTKNNIYHRSKSIIHNTILKKNSIKNKKGKNLLLRRSKSKNKISKCCHPNTELIEKAKIKLKEKLKENEIENNSFFNNLISKNIDNIKQINIANELIKGINVGTYLPDDNKKENFDLIYKRKLIYEDLKKTNVDLNLEEPKKLNNEKRYYLKDLNKGREQTTRLWEYKEEVAEKVKNGEVERIMRLKEEKEKMLEEERRIQEERKLEEMKMLEEMMRIEEERRIQEKRIEEIKKLEEEKRLEEMKRLEEEKRLEEMKRLEEEKRLEEMKRLEEEEKSRMDEWKKRQNKIEQLKRYEEAKKLKELKMIQSAKGLMELSILQGTKNLENKMKIEKDVENNNEINKIEDESGVGENIFSNVLENIYKNTATPLLNHIKGNKTEESEKGKANLLYIVETKIERKDDEEVKLNEAENENDRQSGKDKKMPHISCTENYEIFDKMEKDRKRIFREKKGNSRITTNKIGNRTLLNNAYVNNSLIINNVINKSKEDKNITGEDAISNKELYRVPKKTVEDAGMNTLVEEKKRMLLKIRNNNLKYNSLKEENIRDLVEMGLTHSISMDDKIDDLYDDNDDIFISGTEESFLKIEDNDNIDFDEFKTHVYKESYRKGLLSDKEDVRKYLKNNYEGSSFKSDNIYNENIIMGSDEIKNVIKDNYSNNNDIYGKSISVDIDLNSVLNSFKLKDELKEYEKEIINNKSYGDIDNKENYISKNSEDFYFNFERENMEHKKKNKNNHNSSNNQYNDMGLSKLNENNSELSSGSYIQIRKLNTYGSFGSYAFNFNKKSEEDDPYINYSFEKLLCQNGSYKDGESDNYGINLKKYQSQNMGNERDDALRNTINQLNKLKKTIKTVETSNYYNTKMDEQNMSNIYTDDLKQEDDFSSYSYLSPRKVFNKSRGKYYTDHYSRYYSYFIMDNNINNVNYIHNKHFENMKNKIRNFI